MPNVEPPLKKAPQPIIDLLMAKFTAFPVANLNAASSFHLQLMKLFTMESVTLSLTENNYYEAQLFHSTPGMDFFAFLLNMAYIYILLIA